MPYPFRILIMFFSLFHGLQLPGKGNRCRFRRCKALVDCGIYFFRSCRRNICSQAYDFFIKEKPGFVCSGLYVLIIIHVTIGCNSVQTVGHSSGEIGSSRCLPVAGCKWNFFQLRGRSTWNTAPVPRWENTLIFISSAYDIGTSVGHEVSFQVFPIAIFTTGCTIRNQSHIEGILWTYM